MRKIRTEKGRQLRVTEIVERNTERGRVDRQTRGEFKGRRVDGEELKGERQIE